MRSLLISAFVVMALFLAHISPARAAGGCPQSADRLEAYASCLAPVPGYGMRYRGTAADLDEDHREVMAIMSSSSMVPPQNHNGMTGVVTTNPFYPVGYSMAGAMAYVAASRGYSPGAWYWWNMYPLMPFY